MDLGTEMNELRNEISTNIGFLGDSYIEEQKVKFIETFAMMNTEDINDYEKFFHSMLAEFRMQITDKNEYIHLRFDTLAEFFIQKDSMTLEDAYCLIGLDGWRICNVPEELYTKNLITKACADFGYQTLNAKHITLENWKAILAKDSTAVMYVPKNLYSSELEQIATTAPNFVSIELLQQHRN